MYAGVLKYLKIRYLSTGFFFEMTQPADTDLRKKNFFFYFF